MIEKLNFIITQLQAKYSDYFILEDIEEYDQHVAAKINGKYYTNKNAFNITLIKDKR